MASDRPSLAPAVSSRAPVATRRSRPAGWWQIWIQREIFGAACCDNSAGAERLKVLIFGGAGFVGLNIAAALLARGHGVTLFDRTGLPRAATKDFGCHADRLTAIQGDIRDRQAVDYVIAAGHDAIILGAAITAGPAREAADPESILG